MLTIFRPASGKDKPVVSGAAAAAGGQDEGRSGFARRALDRGLRASNQFLYRSIFNLLPAFIETICVVCMMVQRAGVVVGLTAALVAYSFVGLTMLVMRKRIPILRRQLRDEGKISWSKYWICVLCVARSYLHYFCIFSILVDALQLWTTLLKSFHSI